MARKGYFCFHVIVHHRGKPGKERKHRPQRNADYCTQPRDSSTYSGLGASISGIINQENAFKDMPTGSSDSGNYLIEVPSSWLC